MSYRWPEKPPEGWSPEKPAGPRRVRRVLRNLLAVLLALALLAGLAAGGWLLVRSGLQRWGQAQAPDDRPAQTPSGSQALSSNRPELTMPRAGFGLGVTLELDSARSEALTAREIYDRVLPSVVSVTAHTREGKGSGSGVVMREDGYILTNCHVIEGAERVTVMLLEDGRRYEAGLVGCDELLDIAVLKIDAQGLTAARFGDSDAVRVGDVAYAIGNPMGYLYGTMTDGIISYLDRSQTVEGNEMTLLQTSAVLNSGSSGGALVNEFGQVVGITVAKVSGKTGADDPQVEGLGFAIPISAARPFVNRILDAGESWRPAIGVICFAAEVDGVKGVMVNSVQAGGPAQAAGFREGDLILSANGRAVESVYGLKRVLNDAGVGGQVRCEVLRDAQRLELTAVLIDSDELEGQG